MVAHQSSCCTDAPKPAMRGLAAAVKQVLSPRSSKPQHLGPSSHGTKQGSEMRQWLCGCTAARSNSSITSAMADAYLEAPLVVGRRSSCAAGSMLESDCSAPSKESFMSPPSVDASSDSSNPDDWKSVNGSAGSKLGSRQPSCTVDKFSSYHSSVVFDEHAADAAWRDFMSWRFKWMEVASHQRFSYREADLQRHEADLLQRLQHGSTITLCGSDGMRSSFSSNSAAMASVPPVNAAQSIRDWEMFLERPDFVAGGKARCSGGSSSFAHTRRCRVVHSSTSSAAEFSGLPRSVLNDVSSSGL